MEIEKNTTMEWLSGSDSMLQIVTDHFKIMEEIKLIKKDWYKSKTMWINVLAIVGGVTTAISVDLTAGTTFTIIGIVNMILRVVNKTQLK